MSPELFLTQALLSISYSRCKSSRGPFCLRQHPPSCLPSGPPFFTLLKDGLRREMLVRRDLTVPVWQRQLLPLVFSSGSLWGPVWGALPDDQWRSHFRTSGKVRESRLGGVGKDHPLEPAAWLPLLPWWLSLLCSTLQLALAFRGPPAPGLPGLAEGRAATVL